MTPSADSSTETLLAHAGWMRALALGLVRDPSAADDAALATLLHPPPADAALRPWLSQVVRRLAWRRARSERRRGERELQARDPAGPEEASETLARLDLQRALLDAVRALEEPVRTTIVQRYFEGRSAAEIAVASGVPASTVRARTARGLELLRGRLDRETGSRVDWMALVAPLLPRELAPAGIAPGAVTASTLAQGALTVTLAKIALTAGAAVVAGLAWWSFAADDAPSGARRALVAPAPASEPESEPAGSHPALAPELRGAFEARIIDERGAPWSGAELQVSMLIGGTDQVFARGTSGSDGHARLEFELPKWARENRDVPGGAAATFDLVVRRAGCSTRHLGVIVRAGDVTHLGEIVLVEAGTVRGRVLDELGSAVAGARVGALASDAVELLDETGLERFARTGAAWLDLLLARSTGTDGGFELDDVAPGEVHLWAHAPGRRHALAGPVHVVARHSSPESVIVLPLLAQTDRVAGRVVGPDGRGRPASVGVDVGRGAERKVFFVRADMEGRFEIAVEELDAVYTLTAHDGYDEFTPKRVDGVRPGDLEVTIALGLGTRVKVRVVNVDGAAVSEADIMISNESVSYSAKAAALESGEYEMDLPDGAFRVGATAHGFRETRSVRYEPGAVPSEIVVALHRAPRVRGVVIAGGAPLAGAQIESFPFDQRATETVNGLRCTVSTFENGSCTSDAEGRFELFVDADGPIVVRASAPGWVDSESAPFEAAGAADRLALELGLGGAIEGRVVAPAGKPLGGRIVGAHRGDGRPISTRAAEDGTYRFDGLMPGDWHVFPLAEEYRPREHHYGSTASTEPLSWSCRVEKGRTRSFDLDLAGE